MPLPYGIHTGVSLNSSTKKISRYEHFEQQSDDDLDLWLLTLKPLQLFPLTGWIFVSSFIAIPLVSKDKECVNGQMDKNPKTYSLHCLLLAGASEFLWGNISEPPTVGKGDPKVSTPHCWHMIPAPPNKSLRMNTASVFSKALNCMGYRLAPWPLTLDDLEPS